jgi:hypothetical protein
MRHKQPAEINIGIDRDERLIDVWRREHATSCELVHGDATAFLRTYPFIGDELVYADPPYMPITRRRARVYRCDFAVADHVALLEVLTELPCRVMVSGYDNDLYSQRLAPWRRATFRAMTHQGPKLETVWMNYPEPAALHDARFMGETFRRRQSTRRRHARLLRRFEGMDGVERRYVLSILRSRFSEDEVTE